MLSARRRLNMSLYTHVSSNILCMLYISMCVCVLVSGSKMSLIRHDLSELLQFGVRFYVVRNSRVSSILKTLYVRLLRLQSLLDSLCLCGFDWLHTSCLSRTAALHSGLCYELILFEATQMLWFGVRFLTLSPIYDELYVCISLRNYTCYTIAWAR